MGIIKAVTGAIGGGLADSWLEVIESAPMGDNTVFTRGIKVRKGDSRNQNTKGTADTVSNGSIIHVYDNQFMMLVDGGKVVDYTAEPGYFKVDNSSMPSLFGGQFGDSLKETFSRIKYGGTPSSSQKVFFTPPRSAGRPPAQRPVHWHLPGSGHRSTGSGCILCAVLRSSFVRLPFRFPTLLPLL